MKRRLAGLVLVVFGVVAAEARAAETAVSGDLARLQGRWVTRAGRDHKILVTLDVEGRKARVHIVTPQGFKFDVEGEMRLQENASPRSIDWVGFTGLDDQDVPNVLSIYEIDGSTFRICNGGPNNPRPTQFKAGESILADVHVFERETPKVAGTR